MATRTMQTLLGHGGNDPAWETFHEASKTSSFEPLPSPETVRQRMVRMSPSLRYDGYLEIHLPLPGNPDGRLGDVIRSRETARDIVAAEMSLDDLSTMLFHCYGETRDETRSGFPRKFRVIPSGGAMYPLELYLHASRIAALDSGIYHYDSSRHVLHLVDPGDKTRPISAALVQRDLALKASVLLFVTMIAERSVFKYGERGYRFALLEAGHLAQNFVLCGQALGLGAVTVGGYLDRRIDALLGIDGLDHSTVYMLAAGGRGGHRWLGI